MGRDRFSMASNQGRFSGWHGPSVVTGSLPTPGGRRPMMTWTQDFQRLAGAMRRVLVRSWPPAAGRGR
jgi:hypothetical protein